ncbi:MAG: transposase [Candidatus Nitrosocosmicus sp.]
MMYLISKYVPRLIETSKETARKGYMFTDRASQHQSKKVQEYLQDNKDSIKIFYLPKGSPEFNTVEECW